MEHSDHRGTPKSIPAKGPGIANIHEQNIHIRITELYYLYVDIIFKSYYSPPRISQQQKAGGGVSGSCRIAAAGRPYAPSAHRTPSPNIITNIVPGLQDRKHIPRLEPEPEVQTRSQIMNIIANIYFIGIGCFNLGSVKANGIIKIESHPENICKIHCKAG